MKEKIKKNLNAIIIVVVAAVCGFALVAMKLTNHTQVTVSSAVYNFKPSSELQVLEIPYKGVAHVKKTQDLDKNKKAKYLYHIAYGGKVTLGIKNLADLKIDVDDNKKTVTFTLPKVNIVSKNADIIDVIYDEEDLLGRSKYESAKYFAKQKDEIEEDLNEKCNSEDFYKMAEENVKCLIENIYKPIIVNIDKNYKIEFTTLK